MGGRARRSEGITAELPHNDQELFGSWKDAKRKRDLRMRTLEPVLIDTAAGSDISCGAIRSEAALQLRLPVGQCNAKRLV